MSFFKGRWIFGLFIILLGFTLLLNNLNITNISIGYVFSNFWPVLLILFGLSFLSNKGSKGELITGLFIIFLGVVFLGRNLELFYIDLSILWRVFWPSLLILAGLSFLIGHRGTGKNNFAFLGGIERKSSPWKLQSGSYTAFMGGVELDLTIADIPDGETTLDLTAVMGGISIYVPKDLAVICNGTVVLGGLELLDRSTGGIISSVKSSQNELNHNKLIHIYSRAFMGGIEVKNK